MLPSVRVKDHVSSRVRTLNCAFSSNQAAFSVMLYSSLLLMIVLSDKNIISLSSVSAPRYQ